jgi:hypothetical protein
MTLEAQHSTDRLLTADTKSFSAGLSMYMLDEKWPSLQRVTGVDLSTFKLAVCEEKKADMVSTARGIILMGSLEQLPC